MPQGFIFGIAQMVTGYWHRRVSKQSRDRERDALQTGRP
jgi:hypothetical protein